MGEGAQNVTSIIKTCTTLKSPLLDTQTTHTLYVLNNFCLSGHKKLTTSFTDSAVCLNTLFLQSEFTFLKYKVQILWFQLLPIGQGRFSVEDGESQLPT